MAKSSKKSKDATAHEAPLAASPSDAQNVLASTKTSSPTATKNARQRSGTPARKTAGTAPKARKSPVAKKPLPAQVAVSDDEIRMRAYFLAEQRLREGISGDSSSDWHEARRQLLEEAAGRA